MIQKCVLCFLLAIIISSCNTTTGHQEDISISDAIDTAIAQTKSVRGSAETLAAQTMEIYRAESSQTAEAFKNIPTATVMISATFKTNSNCRTGPDGSFDLVRIVNQGENGRVIAKNTTLGLWYQLELNDLAECWVTADNLDLSSNPEEIPETDSPATPTSMPPSSLWAGSWNIWVNPCADGRSDCEGASYITFTVTSPNTIQGSHSITGCTWTDTLTISSDGMYANGMERGCWMEYELHLQMSSNHNQFKGKLYTSGNSSWQSYYCGARNGYSKPNPTH